MKPLFLLVIMKREIIQGKIQGNERGYAFLLPVEEGKKDYFIPHGDLRGAMHGDTVLAETTESYGGERTTARVLKIIERGITQLVGTYFTNKRGGYIVPDEKKYFTDIFIPFGKGMRAKAGDKVVCKILAYPKKQQPEGMLVKILGRQFDKQAELKAIEFTYKLIDHFPRPVIWAVNELEDNISKAEIKKRLDLRKTVAFTIDGDDSRDFDDAVSIEKNENGYVLGVHIADVSHYVVQGSVIDKEAFERATSVYFPESVIPMLPEKLCNDLCSLKEGVDRLTLSCIMNVNFKGRVVDYKICPSVIRSKARLTYSNVQKILDGDIDVAKKHLGVYNELMLMNELADILIARSEEQGSIDLDVKESAIYVKEGKIEVVSAPRDKAHRIIERFMILANCTVAEYMFYLDKPFIYRIHEQPTEERLQNFYTFLDGLGVRARHKKDQIYPKDFQLILKNAQDKPYYTLINRVMLRSMQKAKYSPEDIGHFGLSLEHYAHFTSPIRRYPDLAIHRIIKDFLAGGQDLNEKYGEFVYSAAKQSSLKERNAIEAERAVDDYYKMLYISNYVGEEFDAVVSGVTAFGVFCELENGVEGVIRVEYLKGKRYKYDAKNYTLTDGKNTFKLGQRVRVKVLGVNMGERKADFEIIQNNPCKQV